MIRRHGSKPTIALWMLVAIADVALLVAAAGALVVLVVVAGAVIAATGVAGFLTLQRRTATAPRQQTVLRR